MTLTLTKTLPAYLLATIFGFTIFSCKPNGKSDNASIHTINTRDLALGPVVHDTLNAGQIEKIMKIQLALSEVNPGSLEETITAFKRDRNPDNEIAIWLAMADAYEKFTAKNPSIDISKKKEAYGLILMRSMENKEFAKAKSNVKLLTDKEVSELFSYYNAEPKPITAEQK